jgi:hypothetical protein
VRDFEKCLNLKLSAFQNHCKKKQMQDVPEGTLLVDISRQSKSSNVICVCNQKLLGAFDAISANKRQGAR